MKCRVNITAMRRILGGIMKLLTCTEMESCMNVMLALIFLDHVGVMYFGLQGFFITIIIMCGFCECFSRGIKA